MRIYFLLLLSSLIYGAAIEPLPQKVIYHSEKAALGKKLFFDPKLSKDGTIACASCHTLPGNGADFTAYSYGVAGAEGNINSPTVLNARYNFLQFWDGRAKTLKDQVRGPIENPVEMANSMPAVIQYLQSEPNYSKTFSTLYRNGITQENIADAIAEFEKALITPNAPFDQYLRGDEDALTSLEKEGYQIFKTRGCISCHNGINIGGNMYQKIGIIVPYREPSKKNLGRYNITHRDKDRLVFKVPSLRNVSQTAPYLHDGSVTTLEDAINSMYAYQLGQVPTPHAIKALTAFLKTLDGETPKILKDAP